MFLPLSKHQKQAMAKILRGALPPEILKRLAEREKAEREAVIKSAADAALAQAEAVAKAEAAYKASLPERMERERQARLLKNAERFS